MPSPAELHSRGAIVRHWGPFSNLRVPTTYGEDRSRHHEAWLQSLYYYAPWPVREDFLRRNRAQITDNLIRELLAEFDWRARRAGAYLAALTGSVKYCNQIGKLLVRSDLCHAARGYCLALAAFNGTRSIEFLCAYLEYYLLHPELVFDQDYVLGTLMFLDKRNGTDLSAPYIQIWQCHREAGSSAGRSRVRSEIIKELTQMRTLQTDA